MRETDKKLVSAVNNWVTYLGGMAQRGLFSRGAIYLGTSSLKRQSERRTELSSNKLVGRVATRFEGTKEDFPE